MSWPLPSTRPVHNTRNNPRSPCKLLQIGLLILAAQLAGCATFGGPDIPPPPPTNSQPPPKVPARIAAIPNAQWQPAPIGRRGNPDNYEVFGETYHVVQTRKPYEQQGWASWYGKNFHGETTSSGEPYNMYAMTAAHKTLPIPSWVRVTNLANGQSVVLKVNDRGPFHPGRIIDVSYVAAIKLGMIKKGTAYVQVKALLGPNQNQQVVASRGSNNNPADNPDSNGNPADQTRQPPATPRMQHVVADAVSTDEMRQINAATGNQLGAPVPAPAPALKPAPAAASSTVAATDANDGQPLSGGLTETVLRRPASAPSEPSTQGVPQAAERAQPVTFSRSFDEAQYLSAGAFASNRNANNLKQRLEDFGLLGQVSLVRMDNDLQMVRLGPYSDETKLLTDRLALKRMGIKSVQFTP